MGSLRAKADAIRTRLAKSINTKYQENPAYYENFSKRIKEALELYKARTITEAEYLAKMQDILEDYRTGKALSHTRIASEQMSMHRRSMVY